MSVEGTRLLYSIAEAGECLSVKRSTVYELLKRGDLERISIGRRALIPADSLERYVSKLRSEQAAS